MFEVVLSVENLSKRFGAVQASKDLSLTLRKAEIHALIGPNGAGKSTLIGQIAGGIRPDTGSIYLKGRDITHLSIAARAKRGLGRSFQVSAVVPSYSVRDNILLALHGRAGQGFKLLVPAHKKGPLLDEVITQARRVKLHERLCVRAAELSHGERRRLELAMVLALKPTAFLLDEPMAGLGREGSRELMPLLRELKAEAPILLVEHDMDAVFALADRISVLVYGEIIATGSLSEIRKNDAVRRAYLGEGEEPS